MFGDRWLDVDIAIRVLGRLVLSQCEGRVLHMTVPGGEAVPLPLFALEEEWQDDIVLSILSERFTEIDTKVTENGWFASFVLWDTEPDFKSGQTEQEALCRAAVAYRGRFPRRKTKHVSI